MSDLISRQEAFDEIIWNSDNGVIDAKVAIEALRKLPSVEPERKTGKWIPVSERLPEPKKDVVVWTIQGNEPRYFVAALFPHKTYRYVWIGEEEIHLYPEQVLYWMSLPNPPVEDKNVGKEESHG